MKNTPTPSNTEADLRAMNEQLLLRIELLTKQLEDSERARSLAEMRTAQLSSKLAASKESLHLFGANWFTPSSITSLTYEAEIGVCLNGIPIRNKEVILLPDEATVKYMADLADEINRAKRKK